MFYTVPGFGRLIFIYVRYGYLTIIDKIKIVLYRHLSSDIDIYPEKKTVKKDSRS